MPSRRNLLRGETAGEGGNCLGHGAFNAHRARTATATAAAVCRYPDTMTPGAFYQLFADGTGDLFA
jgi:hypothetical protein